MKYGRIVAAVCAQVWAMEYSKFNEMMNFIHFAVAGGRVSEEEFDLLVNAGKIHPNRDKAIARQEGAVMVVPVRGIISNRASMIDDISPGSGTSAERLIKYINAGAMNDDIKAMVLDVHSPGGGVGGVQEVYDAVVSANEKKPVVAQVNDLSASAAYWISSAAEEIVAVPSAEIGSIGVFAVHEDISKALEMQGVKETIISAGKFKVEGNPFEPFSEEGRAALQKRIDEIYGTFVNSVAKGRGVAPDMVKDGFGQGRVVGADKALREGTIDRIGTMDETLARFGVGPSAPKAGAKVASRMNVNQCRLQIAKANLNIV